MVYMGFELRLVADLAGEVGGGGVGGGKRFPFSEIRVGARSEKRNISVKTFQISDKIGFSFYIDL